MANTIGIIDVGIGNVKSLSDAVKTIGFRSTFIKDSTEAGMNKCDVICIPGACNTLRLIEILNKTGFSKMLKERHVQGYPVLGICSGMQVMFKSTQENSAENDITEQVCLGLFDEKVVKLPAFKFQQNIGWRTLNWEYDDVSFSKNVADPEVFFMHKYAALTAPKKANCFASSTLNNNKRFIALILKDRTAGVQFHIEKSGAQGLAMLKQIIKFIIN